MGNAQFANQKIILQISLRVTNYKWVKSNLDLCAIYVIPIFIICLMVMLFEKWT